MGNVGKIDQKLRKKEGLSAYFDTLSGILLFLNLIERKKFFTVARNNIDTLTVPKEQIQEILKERN